MGLSHLMLALSLATLAAPRGESILDLLTKVTSARTALTRYCVIVSVSTLDKKSGRVIESSDYKVWRDGKSYRLEMTRHAASNKKLSVELGHRQIFCAHCPTDAIYVRHLEGVSDIVVAQIPNPGDSTPRVILDSMPAIEVVGFTSFLQRMNALPFSPIVPDNDYLISQTTDTLVAVHKQKGFTRTYSMIDDKVASIEVKRVLPEGGAHSFIIRNQYNHPNFYSLPSEVAIESFDPHGQTTTTTQKFNYISLNESIDRAVFTLAGMGVKDGTSVNTRKPEKEPLFVVDGQIVPYSKAPESVIKPMEDLQIQSQPPPLPARAPKNWAYFYAAMCGLFALLAVTLLWRVVRKS